MIASEVISKYILFWKEKDHIQISNSSLVPLNDPTTLFTSSGMQPLVPFLLGEEHPQGRRLVNVQNCFRAVDIDEVGDSRHITFFRMLGNWSLGQYFKKEQLPDVFEFLTNRLNIPIEKLYSTVFEGNKDVPKDVESEKILSQIFKDKGLNPEEHIFYYGVEKNWWSRAGVPEKMPVGEPGGPDSEIFYDLGTEHDKKFGEVCHVNCDCGRFIEIGNSVFMQYMKTENGFEELPQKNVDFGGGLERMIMAIEGQADVFKTSLISPVIESIQNSTAKTYEENKKEIRIIADHMISAVFITNSGVRPSNKERGYILRRLLRRSFDNFYVLNGDSIENIIERIVDTYKDTDQDLIDNFEVIKNVILEEEQSYKRVLSEAKKFINKKYKKVGDDLMGGVEISPDDVFNLYTSYGLSPTQIKSLGYTFDEQEFAEKMQQHQKISRVGSTHKFTGGLADHDDKTIKGHTATHLLQQALRDVLGDSVHQTGSNITSERLRFDFSFDAKLTDEQINKVEDIVNGKIAENLPVNFEMMPIEKAKKLGAIGLFDEKYDKDVKVYFIGDSKNPEVAYSKEFCGGPHVDFTGRLEKFKIIKEEGLGRGQRRIYAVVG